jgi:(3S)-malyl-CoA thioesterase
MDTVMILPPRSSLYMPASNPRAIEKAPGIAADMIILDLEDAVNEGMKDEARAAAVAAAEQGLGGKLIAIRINGPETSWHAADIAAVRASACQFVVLPKVEEASTAERVAELTRKPLFAMIETPRGIFNAAAIAAVPDMAGLIVGTNDLANELHLPSATDRSAMSLALQMIVLAARAGGIWALDGVFNDLANAEGLEAQCREGRALGFDGKTLIHPNQVEATNRIWSPTESELAEARALIDAASGGAERYQDRMIETMHVEMAKRLLERC